MRSTSRVTANIPEFGARLDGIVYIERPGVYAVIENHDKQIALLETRNGYFLPGGGIDLGERELDALKREIMEETGYQVLELEEIGEAVEYSKADSDQRSYRIHSKFFKAQLGSKIAEGIEEDHRLVWLARGDAIRLLLRQGQVWAVQRIAKE
jgi:8-oxo-dGTP diphosphatase